MHARIHPCSARALRAPCVPKNPWRGRIRASFRASLGRYGVLDRYQCPKLVFLDQRLPDGSDRHVVFEAEPGVGITAESVRKFLVERLRVPMLAAPGAGGGGSASTAPTTKEEL